MDDGTKEFNPEDMGVIVPIHNAWMVGNDSIVAIDFTDLKDYAKGEK